MKKLFQLLVLSSILFTPNISNAKKSFPKRIWKAAEKIVHVGVARILENKVDHIFQKEQHKQISDLRIEAASMNRSNKHDLKILLDNIEKLTDINNSSRKEISRLEKIIIQKNSLLIKKNLSYIDKYDKISISTSGWYAIKAKPSLRVRSSPDLQGAKIGSIPNKGKIKVVNVATKLLTVNGHSGRWVLVSYRNTTGYVFSGYLTPIGGSPNLSKSINLGWYTVRVEPHLNIRSAPSVTGKVIGSFRNGKKVRVLKYMSSRVSIGGRYGRWVKVKTSKNRVGYVFDAFLVK